jgi:diguanylate cyclase (GGDEF)-like protein/PAS domain S-box-containing protein
MDSTINSNKIYLASILEHVIDGIVVINQYGEIQLFNESASRMFGYDEKAVIGRNVNILIADPEIKQHHDEYLANFLNSRKGKIIGVGPREVEAVSKSGRRFPIDLAVTEMLIDREVYFIGIVRDITQRQRSQEQLRQINRTYAVLSNCNRTLIHAKDEGNFLSDFCKTIVTTGGYLATWIDFINDQCKPSQLIAHVSYQAGKNHIFKPDMDWYPAEVALKEGKSVVSHDVLNDSRFVSWRKELKSINCNTIICLLIKLEGQVIGALSICAAEKGIFSVQELKLFEKLVEDLAYGVKTLRGHEKQKELQKTLMLRNHALESAKNGITIVDITLPGHPVVYANKAFGEITGYDPNKVVGKSLAFLHGEDIDQPNLRTIKTAIATNESVQVLIRNYRKDGSLFWNQLDIAPVTTGEKETTHFIGIIDDVTKLKIYQERLEYQASHDELTGLTNRNCLNDRLSLSIAHAKRYSKEVYVLFLDLDNFKNINDSLGHSVGDEFLKQMAKRLAAFGRDEDTVARNGGDEFVLILSNLSRVEDLMTVINRLVTEVSQPIQVNKHTLQVTASMGVSVYPYDGENSEALIKNADIAMYESKKQGKNKYCFYTVELNQYFLEHLNLEHDLREALQQNQFILFYQPKYNLQNKVITGVEALIRWERPESGMMSPDTFIPIAEENNLIIPIGEWVLRTACSQVKAWHLSGFPHITISVNVSSKQLQFTDLYATIANILDETKLESKYLDIELTESAVMKNPKKTALILNKLKCLGVQVSMDDFGTGYSSLSYLKRFPFDTLKIDKEFIKDILDDNDDLELVTTIIQLAKNLNIKVVAEGVETLEQMELLTHKKCDEIQGYLISRPIPEQEIEKLLK